MGAAETAVAPSDGELVARVRAGDNLAFEELYCRYQRRISRFVRKVLRDDARAEDVTQKSIRLRPAADARRTPKSSSSPGSSRSPAMRRSTSGAARAGPRRSRSTRRSCWAPATAPVSSAPALRRHRCFKGALRPPALITPNTHLGTAVAERAAALVTAVAIAGAGGAVVGDMDSFHADRSPGGRDARAAAGTGHVRVPEVQRRVRRRTGRPAVRRRERSGVRTRQESASSEPRSRQSGPSIGRGGEVNRPAARGIRAPATPSIGPALRVRVDSPAPPGAPSIPDARSFGAPAPRLALPHVTPRVPEIGVGALPGLDRIGG
jgi:hypothetical protein